MHVCVCVRAQVAYTEGAPQPWQVLRVNDTAHLLMEGLAEGHA